ncbi:NADPH-dependent FMN reductase [Rathayibacter sp. YIM 133350]|uniref:NADPH-dependent FMN reductase n=1 Tax=Rathayibacter sp. YIM 133350 TaxID=3131992 RepID=UPI00307DD17F
MAITTIEHEPPYQVGYFVGSLSSQSINRQLANALIGLAPPELEFSEILIRDLPLYNRDFDPDYPQVARDFKASIAGCDALLFVTPEYNRSLPGALKNAIDWASRPYGENVISRKASAVIGASSGAIGTALAQQSLRGILSFCNAPQMTSPEANIQVSPGLISPEGEVTNEGTREFLASYMQQFHEFIARVLTVLPPHA